VCYGNSFIVEADVGVRAGGYFDEAVVWGNESSSWSVHSKTALPKSTDKEL
jgi:hypothetical protein